MMDKNQPERVQINLDLSAEFFETINKIKQQINGETAEVLLKGIILLEVAVEAKLQGKQVWITDGKQNLESEIIGL
jgi:hypothetical protein